MHGISLRTASAVLAGLLVAACASSTTDPGGPPGPPPTNRPPVVQVVGQVDASMGQTVTLDAGATTDPDGDPITYQWSQVLGPPVGELAGPRPSFSVPTEVGTVAFDVVAKDPSSASPPARIVVRVFEDASKAYFVKASGDDANPGTRSAPYRTIQAAIEAARATGGDVYVGSGTYSESIRLRERVSVYGGFNSDWIRDIATNATRIEGGPVAVFVEDGGQLRLEGFRIQSADAAVPGGSSTAIQVVDARDVIIARNVIVAGAGGNGTPGGGRPAMSPAQDGKPGLSAGACVPPRAGGDGGVSLIGRNGGKGGSGGTVFGGFSGGKGSGAGAGNGGAGGFDGKGQSGQAGSPGNDGAPGSGGSAFGVFIGGLYLARDGFSGLPGTSGAGGGGGGGGSGSLTTCGGGGGGGGAGGGGGFAGLPGQGGGGSFGIVVAEFGEARIVGNDIRTAPGGNGGDGGPGGLGGAGGKGGSAGGESSAGYGGGSGAVGGRGGNGGHGGGGGGGPSVGILESGGLTVREGNTVVPGVAGSGGGGPGFPGNPGQSMAYMKLIL